MGIVIVTKFYKGQGLGNQLWVYAVLRSLAWEKNFSFGIESYSNYKLKNFLPLDRGLRVIGFPHERPYGLWTLGTPRVLFENQNVVESLDIAISQWEHRIANLKNGTKIEGYFQSLDYIETYKRELQNLFQCKLEQSTDSSVCYISVRGGDFRGNPEICCDVFYYRRAINEMRLSGFTEFQIITDDIPYAKQLLPGISVASFDYTLVTREKDVDGIEKKIAHDFSILQNAKALILSNSTFAWWAAWTNLNNPVVIAPRFWSHPRNKYNIWAPKEIAVGEWSYSDGLNLLSGASAIKESREQKFPLKFESKTLKSKIEFKERFKNSVYKFYKALQKRILV